MPPLALVFLLPPSLAEAAPPLVLLPSEAPEARVSLAPDFSLEAAPPFEFAPSEAAPPEVEPPFAFAPPFESDALLFWFAAFSASIALGAAPVAGGGADPLLRKSVTYQPEPLS